MRLDFTIGADPELFIINKKTGKVVSAVGMIPGEKGNPYIEGMPKGFGLETDNILAEFNIPPVTGKRSFINNIQYMKNYIRSFVQNINPDYDIKCSASEIVDEDQLQSDQACEFGCSSDYNAYTEDVNPKPKVPKDGTRSAGFHIHIGYPNHNVQESIALVKFFDAFVGIPSLLYDTDVRRRNIYGKAGCFRLTSYGTEWRSLSSYMLNDEHLSFVWDCVERAIDSYYGGWNLPDSKDVCNAINNSDVDLAKTLIKKYNLLWNE